jgi:hypothetical protein
MCLNRSCGSGDLDAEAYAGTQKQLFLTSGKDTPNTTKDRDMTLTSAAWFLISRLVFPLRADLSQYRSALPVLVRDPSPFRFSDGTGPAIEAPTDYEGCDDAHKEGWRGLANQVF